MSHGPDVQQQAALALALLATCGCGRTPTPPPEPSIRPLLDSLAQRFSARTDFEIVLSRAADDSSGLLEIDTTLERQDLLQKILAEYAQQRVIVDLRSWVDVEARDGRFVLTGQADLLDSVAFEVTIQEESARKLAALPSQTRRCLVVVDVLGGRVKGEDVILDGRALEAVVDPAAVAAQAR